MEVNKTVFIGSFPSVSKCPVDERPEYAFIGRSNVGKSSVINMLCGQKNVARTSKKPGKTQFLNYFLIDDSWYLVDLPGYGYARISKAKRKEWERMIEGYLIQRDTLQCAFVLIDCNIPPQTLDIEFINWLGERRIPFVIVYTKADRLHERKREENIRRIQESLLEYWNELPQQFITSANLGMGRQEILDFIESVNAKA